MYSQSSHSSRQEGHGVNYQGSGHSPSKSSRHRSGHGHGHQSNPTLRSTSSSPGAMLSPGRSRRRTHSNQGSRSDSPMSAHSTQSTHSMPVESTQQNVHGGHGMYLSDGGLTPPYQVTPSHSRSSSMTSVKSGLMRDRSLERGERDLYLLDRGGAMIRDRSLDRQLDRHYERAYSSAARDRSIDRIEREYPHMGARSLDRSSHHFQPSLVRSRSIDHEYLGSPGMQGLHGIYLSQSQDLRRDNLILDMQAQIADLNKECATIQQELDLTREKLSSSMNSIKTFWSPELKKERVMRKEEMGKYAMMNEQLRASQAENQVCCC